MVRSIGVFLNELIALYQQGKLPELPVQYRDYSHWQSALLEARKAYNTLSFGSVNLRKRIQTYCSLGIVK